MLFAVSFLAGGQAAFGLPRVAGFRTVQFGQQDANRFCAFFERRYVDQRRVAGGKFAEVRTDREDRFRFFGNRAERRQCTDDGTVDADFGETFTFEFGLVTSTRCCFVRQGLTGSGVGFVQVAKFTGEFVGK